MTTSHDSEPYPFYWPLDHPPQSFGIIDYFNVTQNFFLWEMIFPGPDISQCA